jgi:hypothetical protein
MSNSSVGQRRRPGTPVLLVGTRHDYQRPGNPGSEEFRAFVAATCRQLDIKVIAEEMSLDGLFGAKHAVCNQVANSLRLTHRYCDPSIEEQKMLGIAHPGKTNPSAFSAVPDPYEVDSEVEAANEIRRHCWLRCIVELDFWPVLFVCGAHHVEPFRELLRANSIVSDVLCPRWTPH